MDVTSRLRLQNDSHPLDSGRWSWSAWVDGPTEELDHVKQVRYTLHPSFPNPIRVVISRQTNFKLVTSGWGEFSLLAQVTFDDGRTQTLERWIRLEGRDEAPSDSTRRRPRVFLSVSGIDRPFVKTITAELEKQDVDVITADNVSIGSSVAESISTALTASDVVGVVLSRGFANTAQHDVAVALAAKKVVVPILLDSDAAAPPSLADLEAVRCNSEEEFGQVADVLASRAKDAFFS